MRQQDHQSSKNRDSEPGPYNAPIHEISVLNDALGYPSNSSVSDIVDSLSALLKRAKTLALGNLAATCLQKIESAYLPPKAGELAFSAGIRAPSQSALTVIIEATRILKSLVDNYKPVPSQVSPAPNDGQSLCLPPVPTNYSLQKLPLSSHILQQMAREFLKQEGALYPEAKKDVPPDPSLLNKHRLEWKWRPESNSWEPRIIGGRYSLLRANLTYFSESIIPGNKWRTPDCVRFIRDLTHILNKAKDLQELGLGANFESNFEKERQAALYQLCAATRR